MSSSKYADLPDIDTAPDVYETEDVFPAPTTANADSSDEEGVPSRVARPKGEPTSREELDVSGLMPTDEASRKFERAERRRLRQRTYYAYPPSPTSLGLDPSSQSQRGSTHLSHRLLALQAELASLETELADPTNPLLAKEAQGEGVDSEEGAGGMMDAGELFRGLVDVRSRLERIKKGTEGRARLVGVVLDEGGDKLIPTLGLDGLKAKSTTTEEHKSEIQTMVDVDRRVAQLEAVVGSASAALDETSPLPSPLLPLITRLNNQLAILTQPRHIDSISRRLKILLADLDRASAVQSQAQAQTQGHKRHPSQGVSSAETTTTALPPTPLTTTPLLPLLTRLSPLLPLIPHILTRLRTLSTLHTSASSFSSTLSSLEALHTKTHAALLELQSALGEVEESVKSNREVVKGNVEGLEGRVAELVGRLEEVGRVGVGVVDANVREEAEEEED